jgi:hypothetical protein
MTWLSLPNTWSVMVAHQFNDRCQENAKHDAKIDTQHQSS